MDLCCAKDPNPLKKNKECTVRDSKNMERKICLPYLFPS